MTAMICQRQTRPAFPGAAKQLRYRLGVGILYVAIFSAQAVGVSVHAIDLSSSEAQGKQIYFHGTSSTDAAVTAYVGKEGVPLPASTLPCAGCHGPDGRGRPEGGVLPTDITWNNLTKSYGHQHNYGRDHPAFTEHSVAAAITQGIDPAGNRLDVSMPRYRMNEADLDSLISFLQVIENNNDPGLTAGSIQLATLLPTSGELATLGKAMEAVMSACIQDINASGGVYGRKIELLVIPFGSSALEAMANLERALHEHGIFALVAVFGVGFETELAHLAEEEHIPVVGPFTLSPALGNGLDRYTFYLFSGIEQQARVLVDYAAMQLPDRQAGITVIGPETSDIKKLGEVVKARALTHGWDGVQEIYYRPGNIDPEQHGVDLRAAGSEVLFFFGATNELLTLLVKLESTGQRPLVFLPSIVATPELLNTTAIFDGQIYVAYPTLPRDMTPHGREDYAMLKQKYALPAEHLSGQLAAYAAVRTFLEGLKRSGRDVSRERLVESIQHLSHFETGMTPPLSYTPNRRIGALGAYIVQLDLRTRHFAQVGEWMSLN